MRTEEIRREEVVPRHREVSEREPAHHYQCMHPSRVPLWNIRKLGKIEIVFLLFPGIQRSRISGFGDGMSVHSTHWSPGAHVQCKMSHSHGYA